MLKPPFPTIPFAPLIDVFCPLATGQTQFWRFYRYLPAIGSEQCNCFSRLDMCRKARGRGRPRGRGRGRGRGGGRTAPLLPSPDCPTQHPTLGWPSPPPSPRPPPLLPLPPLLPPPSPVWSPPQSPPLTPPGWPLPQSSPTSPWVRGTRPPRSLRRGSGGRGRGRPRGSGRGDAPQPCGRARPTRGRRPAGDPRSLSRGHTRRRPTLKVEEGTLRPNCADCGLQSSRSDGVEVHHATCTNAPAAAPPWPCRDPPEEPAPPASRLRPFFACLFCGRHFRSKATALHHESEHRARMLQHSCDGCGFEYLSESELEEHRAAACGAGDDTARPRSPSSSLQSPSPQMDSTQPTRIRTPSPLPRPPSSRSPSPSPPSPQSPPPLQLPPLQPRLPGTPLPRPPPPRSPSPPPLSPLCHQSPPPPSLQSPSPSPPSSPPRPQPSPPPRSPPPQLLPSDASARKATAPEQSRTGETTAQKGSSIGLRHALRYPSTSFVGAQFYYSALRWFIGGQIHPTHKFLSKNWECGHETHKGNLQRKQPKGKAV